MTVEISGTAKLRDMGSLKGGGRSVGICLPSVSAKFYNLKPGMYCEFRIAFPEKQDIIEVGEVDAIVARQKQLQKLDKAMDRKLRQWYEDKKEVYDLGKKDPKFKVPENVRKLFEQPDELQKTLIEILEAK